MEKLFEQVREVLLENLGCEKEEINLKTDLVKDLEADSLDIVELSMALEDEFGIPVADEDFESLQTVENIIDYIKRKSNE